MIVFFAIVGFLAFQIAHCFLCFHVMYNQKCRQLINNGLFSIL